MPELIYYVDPTGQRVKLPKNMPHIMATPNPDEVEAFYWVDWQDYVAACQTDNDTNAGARSFMGTLPTGESRKLGIWSWWCKDQLKQLKSSKLLQSYIK